jgi:hypothetical protein
LKKWTVSIQVNGDIKFLGNYSTFEDAVKVRKENEDIYFKEFKPL